MASDRYFKCSSKEQRYAIILALKHLGYTIDKENEAGLKTQKDFEAYPVIWLSYNEIHLSSNENDLCSLEKLLVPVTVEVNIYLNRDYTAVVTRDGITVGCQEFPLTIIDQLLNARKKVLT